MQIYSSNASSPPSWYPENKQLPAFYYTSDTQQYWAWVVRDQIWVRLAGQQVFGGSGAPTDPPYNIFVTSIYVDLATKIIYAWNGSAWV